jgi:hypothetical protein
MKEFSIEEKAKAYDGLIERLQDLKFAYRFSPLSDTIEEKFPELAESEDEKTKRMLDIITYKMSQHQPDIFTGEENEWFNAWLEKQCEKGTNGNERDFPISEPPLTLKHAKEVMGIKQDDAWSEEDEVALCDALWCCKQAASIAKDENDMGNVWYAEHWLKSLKERYTWKPSEEQMKALGIAIRCGIQLGTWEETALKDLIEQLKKLKE